MTAVVNAAAAAHYIWGEGCDGWPLVAGPDLSVKQERMPPGAAEQRHYHKAARQVFFVLAGVLTMEVDGQQRSLGPRDAIEIAPGQPHQAMNLGAAPVMFLVISAPTTAGDRVEVQAQP